MSSDLGKSAPQSVYCTPAWAPWLKQIEIWFNGITEKAFPRGTFKGVRAPNAETDHLVQHHIPTAEPFVWTATADSILAKIQ
jgi:hypothetical protein